MAARRSIGKWLKRSGKRDRVLIATKVGMEMGPDAKGLAPAYIRRALEASLARLQTDHVDLYQSHKDDPDTPLTDTLGEYAKLIEAGKVRAIGASNYTAVRLSEALIASERHNLPRYESIQPEYNLYSREPFEAHLQALVKAQDLGTINYYALASGFLSGKYRGPADVGKSARGKKIVDTYLNDRGYRILKALDEVAEDANCTPAQAALAWQIDQDAEFGADEAHRPVHRAGRHQALVDQAVAAQQHHPAEGAHDVAGEQRHHQQDHAGAAPGLPAHHAHQVPGQRIAQHQAGEGGEQGQPECHQDRS